MLEDVLTNQQVAAVKLPATLGTLAVWKAAKEIVALGAADGELSFREPTGVNGNVR